MKTTPTLLPGELRSELTALGLREDPELREAYEFTWSHSPADAVARFTERFGQAPQTFRLRPRTWWLGPLEKSL